MSKNMASLMAGFDRLSDIRERETKPYDESEEPFDSPEDLIEKAREHGLGVGEIISELSEEFFGNKIKATRFLEEYMKENKRIASNPIPKREYSIKELINLSKTLKENLKYLDHNDKDIILNPLKEFFETNTFDYPEDTIEIEETPFKSETKQSLSYKDKMNMKGEFKRKIVRNDDEESEIESNSGLPHTVDIGFDPFE